MAVLEITTLHKKFNEGKENEVYVLKGINLSMKEGEFFALMGPSGSGKSTLLNIVGGLTQPTEGSVMIDGKELYDLSDDLLSEMRSFKIGWIFQSFGLINNLTALENVLISLNLAGVDGEKAYQRAREVLSLVGLQERLDHFPDGLSGGQKQRVAIARALANDPSVLLADEPTGNLDTSTGIEIIELFKELATQGKTILMVTHDVKLAHASQKVYILQNGVVSEEKELVMEV
ncbi:MAG: ABC transporter ATP-binding protein [Candidatus Heimdallarchaeota archaeon]|nr:ABC transporter ATP-binding protein [Candidatus Heimdallarchaeota archaeon]